jgi:DNA-binding response OmpR family regulator
MKILVVDDEKLLVKGIKFNLESEGIRWTPPLTARRR